MQGFHELPLSSLRESAANPRKHFDAKALEALAASIRAHGVLTPLLARPITDGLYEIAAGHRRFRAASLAGEKLLPVIVREMTDVELLEVIVVENNQREDIHPLEEGQGYKSLISAGYTVARIAERVGRSVDYVSDRLRLLELSKDAQAQFFAGDFSFTHARLLARLSPADQARALAKPKNQYESDPDKFGVFRLDESLFTDHKKAPEYSTRSSRELDAWITENVRLNLGDEELPRLFPKTAEEISRAAEKAEKIVGITHELHVEPEAKGGTAVITAKAWKRADGSPELDHRTLTNRKSKTCEASILGVVVIGEGRGESFRVCVDDCCEVHWGKQQRDREVNSGISKKERERQAVETERYRQKRAREEALQTAWTAAGERITTMYRDAILAAPIASIAKLLPDPPLYDLILDKKKVLAMAPAASDPEGALRRFVFLFQAQSVLSSYRGPSQGAPILKKLGVNVGPVLKEFAPKPVPQEPKAVTAAKEKKAAKKKPRKAAAPAAEVTA